MMRTIDWFNEHFRERQGSLLLNEQNLDFYQLYMAKKNGKPNDDFPSKYPAISLLYVGIESTQIVAKVNYSRFALCFDPSALHQNPISMMQNFP